MWETVNLRDVFSKYFAGHAITVVLFVAVCYLFMQGEKKTRKYLCAVFIGYLCIYNPICFKTFEYLGEAMTYYRMLWLCPILLIISCFLVDVLFKIKNKVSFICTLVILAVIYLFQCPIPFDDIFKIPENIYQLDNDVIQIADAIDELTDGQSVTFLDNGTIFYSIRQYNANICDVEYDSMGLNPIIYDGRTDFSGNYVRQYLAYTEPDFIAIEKARSGAWHVLEAAGLSVVAESEEYYLYGVNVEDVKKDNVAFEALSGNKVTSVGAEYVKVPNIKNEYNFLYITNLFYNYDEERINEVIEIAKKMDVHAVVVNDLQLIDDEMLSICKKKFEDAQVELLYVNEGTQMLQYEELTVALLKNQSEEMTQNDYEMLAKEIDARQSVVLFSETPLVSEGDTSKDQQLVNYALEKIGRIENITKESGVWNQHVLSENAYEHILNTDATWVATLVRVRAEE